MPAFAGHRRRNNWVRMNIDCSSAATAGVWWVRRV